MNRSALPVIFSRPVGLSFLYFLFIFRYVCSFFLVSVASSRPLFRAVVFLMSASLALRKVEGVTYPYVSGELFKEGIFVMLLDLLDAVEGVNSRIVNHNAFIGSHHAHGVDHGDGHSRFIAALQLYLFVVIA